MSIYSVHFLLSEYAIFVAVHCESRNYACTDRVDPVVICKVHSLCYCIQTVHTTVRSECPKSLILHPCHSILVRSFRNDTHVFTPHGARTASYDFCNIFFVKIFSADLFCSFKRRVVIVARRHTSELIVYKNIFHSSQSSIFLRRGTLHSFVEFFDKFHEFVQFCDRYVMSSPRSDCFEVL